MADAASDPVVKQYREQISDNDVKILEALNKRIKLVKSLKDYKEAQGLSFYDAAQEDWVITYLCRANRGPLSSEGLREVYQSHPAGGQAGSRGAEREGTVRGAPVLGRCSRAQRWRRLCRRQRGRQFAARYVGEILRRHLVQEVFELLDDLFDVLYLLVELDAVGVEQHLGGEDGGVGAHGQGDGVRGPRVDAYLLTAGVEAQDGVEGVVAQLGDEDAVRRSPAVGR